MNKTNKSALVIDTPMSCSKCKLRFDNYGLCEICAATNDRVDYFYGTNTKPTWCPLSPIPKKIDLQQYVEIEFNNLDNGDYSLDNVLQYHYVRGYNSCLHDILRGVN